MGNVQDNKRCYNVAIQGINRSNTSTYTEVCIYPDIKFILYNWYWYMEYTCAIDPSEDNFIFPEFSKTFFKSGESRIDFKVSRCFENSMNVSMALFRK